MSEKCFLKYCDATVGDCSNPKCKCLNCLGKNSDNCEILKQGQRLNLDIQQIICEKCANYNG